MPVLATLIAAASASCQPVTVQGTATLGFEASYIIPSHGNLSGKKIWVPSANELSKHFDQANTPGKMWRRGPLKVKGCLAEGRFGHLGAYKYQVTGARVVR